MTSNEKMECVICLEPVTSQSVLACCHQPCHAQCVSQWKKVRHTISCPQCRQVIPITVLEVTYPQLWKEDAYFFPRVNNVWKDNRFWYGICHDEFGSKDGFWGELKDPYEPNRKTIYYLGYTKRQVIPRMNTCLSFL